MDPLLNGYSRGSVRMPPHHRGDSDRQVFPDVFNDYCPADFGNYQRPGHS